MNQQQLDEHRFQGWLERLELALKGVDGTAISAHDRNALFESIKATTIFDKESIPAWAIRNERVLTCLLSTSEDLKRRLRRLTLPKLSNRFDHVKAQVNKTTSVGTNVATGPLKRDKAQGNELDMFFGSLDSQPADAVVGLCKLADLGYRTNDVQESDRLYLTKLLQFESNRKLVSEQELVIRAENLKYLENADDNQLILTSINNFDEHLVGMKDTLRKAENEEEKARKIYEAALEKVQKTKESIENFQTFVDVVKTQSDVLGKVSTIKMQLDAFNKGSATNRLKLLGSLQNAFNSVHSRLVDQRIKNEFPVLLQNLSEIFRSMVSQVDYRGTNSELTSESAEQPVSLYCALRIGLETINLWTRLNLGTVANDIDSKLTEFGQVLEQLAIAGGDQPLRDIDSSVQYKDSTVVLFYNHICHETPANHIENQTRADSCLKLLIKKLNSQNRQNNPLLGSTAVTSTRQLLMERSNDILSPPLWCLPLVHSPQYLTQLWRFSEEASHEDLFVPLEFETEWETEDEGLDDDVDEKSLVDSLWKKRKNASGNTLAPLVEVAENVKQKIGIENARKLENLLTPRFGDFLIARAIKRSTIQRTPSEVKVAKKTIKQEESDHEKKVIDKSTPKVPAKSSKQGRRVRTPYGSGTLVEAFDSDNESERIIKVKLDWGAVGYMNSKNILRVRRNRMSASQRIQIEGEPEVPASEQASDRFLFTNFTLHRIVRRILSRVKVQRFILDKIGVKDAHLSLWIHGRTSRGITKNIENGIIEWLCKFDRAHLENFLTEKENEPESADFDGLKFMKELESLKLSDNATQNAAHYQQNSEEPREKLFEEGMAYSVQRLTKKSGEMRAKVVRKKQSGPPKSANNTPSKPLVHRLVPATVKIKNPRLEDPLFSLSDGDKVRGIFQRLNASLNISQTWFASEVKRRFGVKTSQTTISSWMRNRVSNVSRRLLDICVLKWIEHHKRLLSALDASSWNSILESYKGVLKEDGIFDFGAVPDATVDMEEDSDGMDISETSEPEIAHESPEIVEQQEQADQDELDDEEDEIGSNADQNGDDVPTDEEEGPTIINKSELIGSEPMQVDDSNDFMEQHSSGASGDELKIAPKKGSDSSDELMSESEEEVEQHEDAKQMQRELGRLHIEFVYEQNRRQLTHSYIAQEAARLHLKLAQPSISKFVRDRCFPFVSRSAEFLNNISRWLAYSKAKTLDGNSCSGCSRSRSKFSTQRDFLNHVCMCAGKEDFIPEETKSSRCYLSLSATPALELNVNPMIEAQLSLFSKTAVLKQPRRPNCCICSSDSSCQECLACFRNFHPECTSDGSSLMCETCQRSIRSEKPIRITPEIARVGAPVMVFDLSKAIWTNAVVLYLTQRDGCDLALIKLADEIDTYKWCDITVDHFDVEYLFARDVARRGVGRPPSNRPKTRKRVAAEDQDDGRKTNRPRRAMDETMDSVTGYSVGDVSYRKPVGRLHTSQSTGEQIRKEPAEEIMTDTYLSANSLKSALCAAGSACRAVDIVMTNPGSNAFVCTRPPGHHAGRYGCTKGCLGTGFCLLNNAAIALTYARVRWGLNKIAIVDIDVHFGNGTADILKGDKDAFFASVHMIYGAQNDGILANTEANVVKDKSCVCGFYPSKLGATSISDRFISVGVHPENLDHVKNRRRRRRRGVSMVEEEEEEDDDEEEAVDIQNSASRTQVRSTLDNFVGPAGFVKALKDVIIPRMEQYQPQLLIISAGFDGFTTDPLGGEMGLSLDDFTFCTQLLTSAMSQIAKVSGDPRGGRVISLLEGGYDTTPETQGLARCVDAHVSALRTK